MRLLTVVSVAVLAAACAREEEAVVVNDEAATQSPATSGVPAAPAAAVDSNELVVQLAPTQGNNANGTLTISSEMGVISIAGTIAGLAPNSEHGIHIHETGDCSAPDASSAGGHFAPLGAPHGAPGPDSHVGDLGNIRANEQGVAVVDTDVPRAEFRSGKPTDIYGKAIVVHAGRDDLKSQPSGDSGDRIACGVIS